MKRPDGKHVITLVLTEQEKQNLELIMARTFRYSWSDCIRAMINEASQKILGDAIYTQNAQTTGRRKRAANP